MEPQQPQPNQQHPPNEDNSGGVAKGSFLCRQSSTRWTPTSDQIRILKDLYYNTGLRSPNAEQIQRISARLRQYGKIEGKNVFYWFQNHKARERQKKRFTTDVPSMQQRAVSNAATWRPEDYTVNNKYPSVSHGISSTSPSSASALTSVGQMGNYGCGSVTMEKCFRECSISAGASNGVAGGSMSHNYGWLGIDPYGSSYSNLLNKQIISAKETLEDGDPEEEEAEEGEAADAEIETLPLFPMHHEDNNINNAFCSNMIRTNPNNNNNNNSCNYKNWYGSNDGNPTSHTSLELSLNSYSTARSPEYL